MSLNPASDAHLMQRHHNAPQRRACSLIANCESRIATLTPSLAALMLLGRPRRDSAQTYRVAAKEATEPTTLRGSQFANRDSRFAIRNSESTAPSWQLATTLKTASDTQLMMGCALC
jgi:hypothetical protein